MSASGRPIARIVVGANRMNFQFPSNFRCMKNATTMKNLMADSANKLELIHTC